MMLPPVAGVEVSTDRALQPWATPMRAIGPGGQQHYRLDEPPRRLQGVVAWVGSDRQMGGSTRGNKLRPCNTLCYSFL
jgi:hypothetical protein